jgi:hypothetical protein
LGVYEKEKGQHRAEEKGSPHDVVDELAVFRNMTPQFNGLPGFVWSLNVIEFRDVMRIILVTQYEKHKVVCRIQHSAQK